MKTWRKLLLFFVSLTGVISTGVVVIMACSGEPDPYDYYTSFFQPNVQGEKDYGAFYFTDYRFNYDDQEPLSEADINAGEWANYLSVKSTDVKKVMYGLDSVSKAALKQHLSSHLPLPDSLASNTFLSALKMFPGSEASRYLAFVLEVESLANRNYDYWDPAPIDTTGLFIAANAALNTAELTRDSFIKLRYYYQAQRLWHYGHDYEKARNVYEQHIEKINSKSHVKGWALSFKAGEDRWLGDTTKAAFLFSKIFANYPERRVQAYKNYHYLNTPFNDVLQLAITTQDKANLYAIRGFSNPEIEMEDLEQVYKNEPSSPMVGVLLVREINKLEQSYLTPALANNTDAFYNSNKAKFITKAQPKTTNLLLIISMVLMLIGAAIWVLLLNKKIGSMPLKLTGSLILIAGVGCLAWYTFSRYNQHADPDGPVLSQGNFFVKMPDSIKVKYETHIEKIKSFCSKLAEENKYTEPQLGLLTNAYLDFLTNNTAQGLITVAKLDGKILSAKLIDQKQIINLVLSAQRLKDIKSVDELALLPSLKWLNKKAAGDDERKIKEYNETPDAQSRFAITERNFYTYILAPAYLRQGDTAKAALVMLKSNDANVANYSWNIDQAVPDFWFTYLHSGEVKQILNWKNATRASSYISFLGSGLKKINNDKLYELLGTAYLREHVYSQAAIAFKQIKDPKLLGKPYNGEDAFQGDPFEVAVNDYPKSTSDHRFTKLMFAMKMADLETKIKADSTNADANYQMANGLYNTSTYGNSWGLIAYTWSSLDYGRPTLYYYDDDYIQASLAKKYYLKAKALTKNPELQAKCTFMAANCEQKRQVAPSYYDYENYEKQQTTYIASLKKNVYFKEMEAYKATEFYKQAVEECSYLRDYLAQAVN
jgi:hypothetical protein